MVASANTHRECCIVDSLRKTCWRGLFSSCILGRCSSRLQKKKKEQEPERVKIDEWWVRTIIAWMKQPVKEDPLAPLAYSWVFIFLKWSPVLAVGNLLTFPMASRARCSVAFVGFQNVAWVNWNVLMCLRKPEEYGSPPWITMEGRIAVQVAQKRGGYNITGSLAHITLCFQTWS